MVKVRAVFDGEHIVLLEPITLAPNTAVEVLIPDDHAATEELYWQRLQELGLITRVQTPPADDPSFTPIDVSGVPLSETIIEERR